MQKKTQSLMEEKAQEPSEKPSEATEEPSARGPYATILQLCCIQTCSSKSEKTPSHFTQGRATAAAADGHQEKFCVLHNRAQALERRILKCNRRRRRRRCRSKCGEWSWGLQASMSRPSKDISYITDCICLICQAKKNPAGAASREVALPSAARG